MSALGKSIPLGRRGLAVIVAILVVVAYVLITTGDDKKVVTVYFGEAISIYPGTDVDVMGVPIGRVDSVTPQGAQVKVKISYNAKYKLPADVRAAIITPTLVADRFVQLAPAYGGGPVLADQAEVPMNYANGTPRNAAPIELDDIYKSLADLTKTLGPNGVNKDGSLNALLHATAQALKGNGALGNQAIANLSKAAQTLGDNSNQIFGTVDGLAGVTTTLQQNDKFVAQFMTHLATASSQLAGESGDLQKALAAVAGAVGTVQSFVHDNRTMLKTDIEKLTDTTAILNRQKQTLGDVLQYSALGLGNLNDAYDNTTGTIGIRAQLGPTATDLGNVLCDVVMVNQKNIPNATQICALFNALLGGGTATNLGAGLPSTSTNASAGTPARNGIGALLSGLGLGGKK